MKGGIALSGCKMVLTRIDAVHDSQESELTYLRDFVGNQVCSMGMLFSALLFSLRSTG
jgi:hypothetical protein